MTWAGCYVLHLRCDKVNEKYPLHGGDYEFTGETKREAVADAKKRGWTINSEGLWTCHVCNGEAPRSKP